MPDLSDQVLICILDLSDLQSVYTSDHVDQTLSGSCTLDRLDRG